MHFLGGAALAGLFFHAIGIAGERLGSLRAPTRYVLSFALVCTASIFWEIAEFATDRIAGTVLQEGLADTMEDLILDIVGATLLLGVLAYSQRKRSH